MMEKGQIVIVSGERLLNQKDLLGYLMVQRHSLYLQEINKREPNRDYPYSFEVIDELPMLLKIEGMSEGIADIASWYRGRKVCLMVIIQSLSQLSENLLERAWTFGNFVTFAMGYFAEAEQIGYNQLQYDPLRVKQYPLNAFQNPTTEPHRGQYAQYANWIQNLKHRECLVKRYFSEAKRDPYVRHVRRTPELPPAPPTEAYEAYQDRLIRSRAVPIREALAMVNNRRLPPETNTPPEAN
jgi:hypothetical protein